MSHEYRLAHALAEPAERRAIVSTASQLFKTASRECPASITAQGAYIAKAIREGGIPYHPETMISALLTNKDEVSSITGAANALHVKLGVRRIVTDPDIRRIIKSDFRLAKTLDVCTMEDLDDILGRFEILRRQKLLPAGEMKRMRFTVQELVNQRCAEQGLPTDVPLFTLD